jgi:hypothetical protein
VNFLKLSLVAGFLLPSVVAADCATDQMLVATTSMSLPKVQSNSFAAKPKVFYKAGTKYGRIEEQKMRPRQGVLLLSAGACAIVALLGILRAFQAQAWWRLLLVYFLIAAIAGVDIEFYRLITSLKREAPR